jgi:Anti-sigma factor NepR
MGRRPADMTALIGAIGARLRTLHADVLNEEIPKKIAELTAQLDQTTGSLILREQVGSDQRAGAQRR